MIDDFDDDPYIDSLFHGHSRSDLRYGTVPEITEAQREIREVKISTSCPPGTEEVFQELLKLRQSALRKVHLRLSVLPSQYERLNGNGMLKAAAEHSDPWGQRLFDHISPKTVGKYREKGNLGSGFYCGDIDTNEMHEETALRHLIAYLHYFLVNLSNWARYSDSMASHFNTIQTALESGKFVYPDDQKELD